ncbi:MAG: twin transmembrane helix small protein [Alphaproteobacteria bacterium]|nr:twin transmembrane helix small protein [Alphaproteobacteria bacterium]
MDLLLKVLPYVIGLVVLGVVISLFTGLGGVAHGGDFNRRHGNKMMRWRVGLQGLALALLAFYAWLRNTHG